MNEKIAPKNAPVKNPFKNVLVLMVSISRSISSLAYIVFYLFVSFKSLRAPI